MVIDVIKRDRSMYFKLSRTKGIALDIRKHLSIDVKNIKNELISYPSNIAMWKVMKDLIEDKLQHADSMTEEKLEKILYQYDLVCYIIDAMEEKRSTLFNLLERKQSIRNVKKQYLTSPEVIKLQTLLSA